jgi:hypothetical protein
MQLARGTVAIMISGRWNNQMPISQADVSSNLERGADA